MGAVTVIAMLPFLAGSAPTPPTPTVLTAGAPQAVAAPAGTTADDGPLAERAVGGGPAAGLEAADASAAVAGAISALAAGADQILFPGLQLGAADAVSTLSMPAGRFGLSWPLHGPEASGFGPRIHPVLGRPMFHTGIDLMATCGTPIRAAADGEVAYAAITPSWGRRVILRHSSSLETGYAHMSLFLVKQGDVVKRGQVIGLVGTTGWSTGCHLHFDVIVNGNYTDPAPYLGLPGTSAAEVPYHAAPYVSAARPGTPARTVEDGDVPVSAAVPARPTSSPAPKPTTSSPTTSATTRPTTTGSTSTTSPTGGPSTSTGTTTTTPDPTTSTTSAPTTTTPDPTTSTTPDPTTSTTSAPTTTTPDPTTSSDPPTSGTTSGTPAPSTTSEPAPATASSTRATPSDTATASATETVAATTEALLTATATGTATGTETSSPAAGG